jgi:hypothetical protein
MKFLERFRKPPKQETAKDVTDLAKLIGPLVDELVNDIFLAYREILIAEPITYIVPAVWGAIKNERLSPEQQEINHKVVPVIHHIFGILQIGALDARQTFAIGFIIRGLIVSKITYMIEALKNKLMSIDINKRDYLIKNMEPMGHA